MTTSKTQGIVLNSFDYGDNDKIITIFSEKFGKFSFLGMGVNKIISKNKYSLLTFSLSDFEVFKSRKNSSLSKLKTGILINNHLQISTSYDNYLYASAICSTIEQGMEFGQKNFKLFQNLKFYLQSFSQNENPLTSFVAFLFFNLKFFGGRWQLNRCFRCQKRSQIFRCFSLQEYGMICPNCWQANDQLQDQIWLHFLYNWDQKDFKEAINKFIPINYLIVLTKTLINYYQEILGIDNLAFRQILNKHFFQNETFLNYTYSVLTR